MNTVTPIQKVTEQNADAIYYFIRMPKHFGEREMRLMDQKLQQQACAAISQDCSRGYANATYRLNEMGLYEVRQLQNVLLGRVAAKLIFATFYAKVIITEYHSDSGAKETVYSFGNNKITRMVMPNTSLTVSQALENIGTNGLHLNDSILESAPKTGGEKVEVTFFQVEGRSLSMLTNEEIMQEYELRGLKPADPHSIASANTREDLGSSHPNATLWKDANGRWNHLLVSDMVGVKTLRSSVGLHGTWWFAGIQK